MTESAPISVPLYERGTPEFKARAERFNSPRVKEYVASMQKFADVVNGGRLTDSQIRYMQLYNYYMGNIG